MTTGTTKRRPPTKSRIRHGRAGGWTVETAARDARRPRTPLAQTAFMFASVPAAHRRWQADGAN